MGLGVIVVPLRHRVVPGGLLGRVSGAYALLDVGGAALGSLAGGLLARGDSWRMARQGVSVASDASSVSV